MKILLVEPDYRHGSASFIKTVTGPNSTKKRADESLWYPPIGLLKLATFHKMRGDEVKFVIGCDKSVFRDTDLFSSDMLWDRIYITTLFTFDWDNVIKTIEFYKKSVGGSIHKIFVGGIMASIMPNDIFEETGIQPVTGVLNSPQQIGLAGDEDIDLLPPDYTVIDNRIYAINDTYYAYATRGCTNKCPWCGVPEIEPTYLRYLDIKPTILKLRDLYGDKPRLKLMDNNILASPDLERIVEDLLALGYGRGQHTNKKPSKARVIDFNQGLDATHITENKIALIEKLNIRPMRIAFDKLGYRNNYEKAVRLAYKHGFKEFSNYMLYNEKDSPRDLHERLMINIRMNEEFRDGDRKASGAIYSYPMRFAPIRDNSPKHLNRKRDFSPSSPDQSYDYFHDARWTKRFTRNIEVIKGAAHGAISPTPSLAMRAIGKDYDEFIANLYMPEELLRNRNKYEAKIYPFEPERTSGTGDVERFREFILRLLNKQNEAFMEFHAAVSPGSKEAVKQALNTCKDSEVRKWLKWYLK